MNEKQETELIRDEYQHNEEIRTSPMFLQGTSLTKPLQPKVYRSEGNKVFAKYEVDGKTVEPIIAFCKSSVLAILIKNLLNDLEKKLEEKEKSYVE